MTRSQLQAVKKALRVCSRIIHVLPSVLRPGASEIDVSRFIAKEARAHGYFRLAFPTIIAAGSSAYDFHHSPTSRRIRRDDMIVVDFGVRTAGTCTDLTRTFFLGRPSRRFRQVYTAVRNAQQRAFRTTRPGAQCVNIDRAARSYLASRGFGRAFRHTTGHGVGFRIHQKPRLGPKSSEVLRVGDIVTIEPGVYLRGWGGVRIEDMAEVTAQGAHMLSSHIPSDLHSMVIAS